MKIEITYMSVRGMDGHENIYPERAWLESDLLSFNVWLEVLRREGFLKPNAWQDDRNIWIMPSAILNVRPVRP